MKKIFLICVILLMLFFQAFATTEEHNYAANFLVQKGIIGKSNDYKLDSNITRREMLKVMMNLTDITLGRECRGEFVDLSAFDWGCKYAEEALDRGFIAKNKYFRPDDYVTEIEALKMILQSKNVRLFDHSENKNWWDKYIDTAHSTTILRSFETVSMSEVSRGRVFYIASRTFFDSGIDNKIIEGKYVGYFYGFGHVIEIDEKRYPFVHSIKGIIAIGQDFPLILPGTVFPFQLISQKRFSYDTEALGSHTWNTKIKVLGGIFEVTESVFDGCGKIESYKDQEWYYNGGWNHRSIDKISEACVAKELGLMLYATSDNSVWMNWLDVDSYYGGVSPMSFELDLNKSVSHSFIEFGKRKGEIIPMKFQDTDTGEVIWIEYNFVQHKVVSN